MTEQRMTRRLRGNALLSLWVCRVILGPGMIIPAVMAHVPAAMAGAPASTPGHSAVPPRAAADTFMLTATRANFTQYYPTYLANGYWSVASSLLGTAPTVPHMAGLMDYEPADVSTPAPTPTCNKLNFFHPRASL